MMLNYGVIVSRLGRSRRDRLLLQLLLHHLLLLMYGALLSDLLNHISDLIRLIRDKRLLVRWNEAIRHCRALTATTAKRLHPEDPLPRKLFTFGSLLFKSFLLLLLFLLQYLLLLGLSVRGRTRSSSCNDHLLLEQELPD